MIVGSPTGRASIMSTRGSVAGDTIADVDALGLWDGKVVTEVQPVGEFWEAEPDHQDYLEKRPGGCQPATSSVPAGCFRSAKG